MYKLFMAFRYMRSHWIVSLSILGVAIGLAAIIVVNSVMSGFSRDIRERIRGMQSHLVVKGLSSDIHISDYDLLAERIRGLPNVAGASPRVHYVAWLGYYGREADVNIVGIDPAREMGTSKIEEFFGRGTKKKFGFDYDGRSERVYPGIVVGSELARLFGGPQRCEGATPGLTTVRRGTVPRICNSNFEVVGTFNSGMNEYDTGFLFMDLGAAQDFLKLRGPQQSPIVSYIAVNLTDYAANVEEARRGILELLHEAEPCRRPEETHRLGMCGLYMIRTWEEEKRTLLQAVAIEKGLQVVLLFFIIVVAAMNILTIYTLMVRSKTRDIGILRSLGATTPGVAAVFLMSGLLCGLAGSCFGAVTGLKVALNLADLADGVETGSRDLAAWARANPDSGWTRYAWFLGIGGILFLGATLGIGLWRRRKMRPLMDALFGTAWIFLLAGVASGLVRQAASWAPDSALSGVVRAIGIAVFAAVAFARVATFFPACRGFVPLVHRAAQGLAAIGILLGLAGTMGTGELLKRGVGEWVFNLLFSSAAIFLAFRYGGRRVESAAPYWVNFAIAAAAGLFLWPIASLLSHPPPPGWPGWNLFPKDVYYLDRIPTEINLSFVGIIIVAGTAAATIASIYPAVKAAQYDPVEAIRRE